MAGKKFHKSVVELTVVSEEEPDILFDMIKGRKGEFVSLRLVDKTTLSREEAAKAIQNLGGNPKEVIGEDD